MWKVFFFLIVLLIVCLKQPLKEYLFVEDYEKVNYGKNSNSIKEHDEIKNIYGENLKQCRHKHEQGNSGSGVMMDFVMKWTEESIKFV